MFRSRVAAILLLLAAVPVLPMAAHAPPAPGEPVAAVFAPGTSLPEAMRRVVDAGGTPLRGGPFGNVIVARSAHPDFAASLHRQGVWLLLDPVLAGCAAPGRMPS